MNARMVLVPISCALEQCGDVDVDDDVEEEDEVVGDGRPFVGW
jgi:hypothetical protein